VPPPPDPVELVPPAFLPEGRPPGVSLEQAHPSAKNPTEPSGKSARQIFFIAFLVAALGRNAPAVVALPISAQLSVQRLAAPLVMILPKGG
jgi:hypothetical protein